MAKVIHGEGMLLPVTHRSPPVRICHEPRADAGVGKGAAVHAMADSWVNRTACPEAMIWHCHGKGRYPIQSISKYR